jgi:3'-phosphoadenosine 5'-phosphosulfate sulfotransferase (PAPS reductase)/FAD synthetase
MSTITFHPSAVLEPVERKIDNAISAILQVLAAGHPLVIAFSGGKDSSVVAALVLHAASIHRTAGGTPLGVATTGDTLVESPEVAKHYRSELVNMRAFGKAHGFQMITRVVKPSLSSTFQVKVLSGRALPSFPGTHGDCTTDLKISPQRTYRRQLFRQLAAQGRAEAVTCLGTRYDEGARRAAGMRERGESDQTPMRKSTRNWS